MQKVLVFKPDTWVQHKPENCSTCLGSCCSLPVNVKFDDLVRLGIIDESAKKENHEQILFYLFNGGHIERFRDYDETYYLATKSDKALGSVCKFLDTETRKCTVYEKRPDVCRGYPNNLGAKCGFCPYKSAI